ncbi:MAG: STAS domain-containing protein [Phycisphaeraceae bacterium]
MPVDKRSDNLWLATLGDDTREQLDQLLADLRDERLCPSLVVDLARVRLLTSGNLSQLLRIRQMLIENDVHLRLAGARGEVWTLFTTTGLDKVFQFAADADAAAAALTAKA